MAEATMTELDAITAKETWTYEDQKELFQRLFASHDAADRCRAILGELEAANPEPRGGAALKIGIARYMLCRFTKALDALASATDNKDRRYFQAQCCKRLREYDQAAEELARAKDRGWDDPVAIDLELVEVQALGGDPDGAAKALAKLEKKAGDRADYFYVLGLTRELGGAGEQAAEAYVQAREIDSTHVGAGFRLAYYRDLHGDEKEAIDLYKECLNHPPVHANALVNLAVLYEDAGLYDQAAAYLRRVLSANPNHQRARLFLKDAQASMNMFYDEEQAKRIARRNAVLDIPVTDFELSVRARNCLKKMSIRSLGDLVRTTEPELLGYKNFGETSLKEIKDMLNAKGLHLGQALEEGSELADYRPQPEIAVADDSVLATPLERVELSVRARRALDSLELKTLGDLAAKSEAELLACRNFGQTSLNEIRQRLSEHGLKPREAS